MGYSVNSLASVRVFFANSSSGDVKEVEVRDGTKVKEKKRFFASTHSPDCWLLFSEAYKARRYVLSANHGMIPSFRRTCARV